MSIGFGGTVEKNAIKNRLRGHNPWTIMQRQEYMENFDVTSTWKSAFPGAHAGERM